MLQFKLKPIDGHIEVLKVSGIYEGKLVYRLSQADNRKIRSISTYQLQVTYEYKYQSKPISYT